MEHDIYWERQRALIERTLASEREERELQEALRIYRHEVEARKAYFRLQRTKHFSKGCRGRRNPKKVSTAIEHGMGMTIHTKRFPESHITVCCKKRLC